MGIASMTSPTAPCQCRPGFGIGIATRPAEVPMKGGPRTRL
jgi:hypothetical protein